MSKLSDIELRKAVAEKLGWTHIVTNVNSVDGKQYLVGLDSDSHWKAIPAYEGGVEIPEGY